MAQNQQPVKAPPERRSVTIEAPLTDIDQNISQFPLHLDFRVEPRVRLKLLELASALDRQQAKLKNGIRVTLPTQAAQWLVEQLDK